MSNITPQDRIKFVGASEVADLFGVGFKSRWQLFLEKAGRIEPEDLSDNPFVQAGLYLEPAIAAWAADKWSMNLRKVRRYIKHPHIERFGCSLDYESQEGSLIPVEIKWSQCSEGWELDGDTILDAPFRYLLQVQAQLAVTGAPYGWLIVLLNGKLCRMRIDMHREAVAQIEDEVAIFWTSVDNNQEPKPDFSYDGGTIASLMSVNKETVVDMTSSNRLPELCSEYLAGKDIEKDGKARAETALAEIRSIIGDAGKVLTNGFNISQSMVAEQHVSYVRKGYPLTRITQHKPQKETV